MYKIEDVIQALLYYAGSQSIKTKIVKACYLLESEYFDKTGKRLTNIEYIYYLYGPYSRKINNVLIKNPNFVIESKMSKNKNNYQLIRIVKEPKLSKFDSFTLSLIKKWGHLMVSEDTNKMLKLAHEDKNFIKTPKEKNIQFNSEFLKKKETLKQRVKNKFRNYKLTKKDFEALKAAHEKELVNYSKKLLIKNGKDPS